MDLLLFCFIGKSEKEFTSAVFLSSGLLSTVVRAQSTTATQRQRRSFHAWMVLLFEELFDNKFLPDSRETCDCQAEQAAENPLPHYCSFPAVQLLSVRF